jgi:hypothetical protein
MFRPIQKKGIAKYGAGNKMTKGMLARYNLTESTKEILAEIGSHGLAKNTWSTYGTAQRMLAMCGKGSTKVIESGSNPHPQPWRIHRLVA